MKHSPFPRGGERRGIGVVLPIVLGLMIVLLTGATLQLFRTGSSLEQAARDAGGAVAEHLATSAIEEGLWHFQELVNDPQSELYEKLRRAFIAGDVPTLDLTKWCSPALLREHLERSPHSGFYRSLTIDSFGAVARVPTHEQAPGG